MAYSIALVITVLSSLNFFLIPVHAASSMYQQGFAKGVQIADANAKGGAIETHHVNHDDLDCDSDVDPPEANPDYCDGVNNGYAYEANKLSGK
jgi:hypothetical protein